MNLKCVEASRIIWFYHNEAFVFYSFIFLYFSFLGCTRGSKPFKIKALHSLEVNVTMASDVFVFHQLSVRGQRSQSAAFLFPGSRWSLAPSPQHTSRLHHEHDNKPNEIYITLINRSMNNISDRPLHSCPDVSRPGAPRAPRCASSAPALVNNSQFTYIQTHVRHDGVAC